MLFTHIFLKQDFGHNINYKDKLQINMYFWQYNIQQIDAICLVIWTANRLQELILGL
jgi:hypothetical protein